MILITPTNEIEKLNPSDLICFKCEKCSSFFKRSKTIYLYSLKPNTDKTLQYCSVLCSSSARSKSVDMICKNCNEKFYKIPSQIKKTKNHFCSRSCAATYNNKNKKHGIRRSKLEVWLEEQLSDLYPDLEIHYNQKDTIGSELDIYIPSLKLAFELNGIFHYEPIFGEDKLDQIQTNDQNKFQACQQAGISLCIIDVSSLKYFKPKNAKKYLDIVLKIIMGEGGFEPPTL